MNKLLENKIKKLKIQPEEEDEDDEDAMDTTDNGLGGGGAVDDGGCSSGRTRPTKASYIPNKVGTRSSAVVVPENKNKNT